MMRESGGKRCAVAAWLLIAAMLCTFIGHRVEAQDGIACRYEISAIIPGPFCEGWGEAPMFARGLSNHNPPWVTGFYTECTVGPDKAFVWTGSGAVQPLQFPGAGVNYSYCYDVTDSGLAVGAYAPNDGPWRGFIFDVASGVWTQVDPEIPEGGCVLRAANNDGMVVGNRTISQTAYNAFIYDHGAYTDLGVMNGPYSEARDISEDGTVVGWCGTSSSSNNARAFIHQNGITTIINPPAGGFSTAASFVDNTGRVGLHCRIPNPNGPGSIARGAIWFNGQMSLLEPLPGYQTSFVSGIEQNAVVLGTCGAPISGGSGFIACIWREGLPIDLNLLISNDFGLFLYGGIAINERGEVLCEALQQGEQVAVVLTPVIAPIADLNLDCHVNVLDLLTVIEEWGKEKSPADLNEDGLVGVPDLLVVINNWTFN